MIVDFPAAVTETARMAGFMLVERNVALLAACQAMLLSNNSTLIAINGLAGLALALGKPVLICGPRENIFHFLPEVRQFDSFEGVFRFLQTMKGKAA